MLVFCESDKFVWWKVEHLGDGRIGYILRRHVVIDYSQGLRATGRNLGLLERPTTSRTTVSPTNTMNSLPLELLDIILQKSYLHYALNRDRFKDENDRFLVTRLATVDRCWSERMRRRKFKRIIWRRLSFAFNKIHRISFILRNNQSFLMETMRLREGFIDQLRLCDCLTDVQSRIFNRQTVTSGKRKLIGRNNSSDLLHVVRSCNDTIRSDCFRCLRQSSQKLVTKVIDNGGVAIKINLCGRDAGNLHLLTERLNDLQDKAKLRSDRVERAIRQLIDSRIEIFHSDVDRQAVLYLWCKSQVGVINLRTLCESQSIRDVIGDLTQKSPAPELIGSRMVDVDIDQFKKAVVVCPIVDKFVASLDINEDEEVKGVTMLRQEFCILCRTLPTAISSPRAIRVYQNRNPFRLNARIDINFVKYPRNIGSSDVEDCFFVHDLNCVWKIARHGGNYHKFLQFAQLYLRPPTLSVSSDGQELLILTLTSLEIYRTFGIEGAVQKPLLIVQLLSDIVDALHAVETSSGHFIILHSLAKYVDETAECEEEQTKQVLAFSKVTRDGRLVVRRLLPQNGTQELNDPSYLAIGANDRVFVADERNDRVFVLDSDFSWS